MKLKKIAALCLVVVFVVSLCSTPVMASYNPEAKAANIENIYIAPAKLNPNRSVSWYGAQGFHISNSEPGSVNTDLGKLKSLVRPSNVASWDDVWTGFFIEMEVDPAATVTFNKTVQSSYRNSGNYGFYLSYDQFNGWNNDFVITSKYGAYTYTYTINMELDGTYTLKPSGRTSTIG